MWASAEAIKAAVAEQLALSVAIVLSSRARAISSASCGHEGADSLRERLCFEEFSDLVPPRPSTIGIMRLRPVGLPWRQPTVESSPTRKLVEHPLAFTGNRLGKREQRRLVSPSGPWLIAAKSGRPRLRADDFAFLDHLVKVITNPGRPSAEQLDHTGGRRPSSWVLLGPRRQWCDALADGRCDCFADGVAERRCRGWHGLILADALDAPRHGTIGSQPRPRKHRLTATKRTAAASRRRSLRRIRLGDSVPPRRLDRQRLRPVEPPTSSAFRARRTRSRSTLSTAVSRVEVAPHAPVEQEVAPAQHLHLAEQLLVECEHLRPFGPRRGPTGGARPANASDDRRDPLLSA